MSQKAPLQWLRSFHVAAEELSFTRAAVRLHLTQAAVSKHIKGLEAWLGLQLFLREAHSIALTEQGRRYYNSSAPMLQQLDRLTQQFAAREQKPGLKLRCNISYGALVLPSKLHALSAAFPELSVDINNGIWEPDHPSENAHLEIGYAPRNAFRPNRQRKWLARDKLFPVIATGHSLRAGTATPTIHVAGYSGGWRWWLAQQSGSPRHALTRDWMTQLHSSSARTLQTDNSLSAYQLCAQGLGIALARSCLVQAQLDNGQLRALPHCKALPAPEGFFARLSAHGQEHAAARALFELL